MSNKNKSLVADKLENTSATKHNNYWSPLACLVKEQEEKDDNHIYVDHLISITRDMSEPTVKNKITEKWKRKIANRSGILDTGCTSGAGPEMDMDFFHHTGLPSKKVFMLPDKSNTVFTTKPYHTCDGLVVKPVVSSDTAKGSNPKPAT